MLRMGQGHISIELENVIEALMEQGPVLLLESQSPDHPEARVSYVAALPESRITAYGEHIEVVDAQGKRNFKANPWEALKEYRDQHPGWHFGFLGYDLKNHLEDLHSSNPDPLKAPDLFFFNPGLLLKLDPRNGDMTILKGDLPIQISLDYDIEKALDFDRLASSVTRNDYLQTIQEAQRRIREGDFYEINLSHQLSMDFAGDSLVLYQKMKEIGPVPFGAFLSVDQWTACCASPERFIGKRGKKIFSQPIKGTVGRGATRKDDERLKKELAESDKERAENLMIVDLVRHDFNRVAKTGSVRVPELFGIQTFGTLHQMVSTVEAEVEEADPVDIVKACFPMGSMTGAPKISAMRSIEELESYRRGIYSGTVGYFKPDGDFDFNVVIRTALVRGDRLYYSVGGAITSDSEPEAEWEETLVKAKALTDLMGSEKISLS